MPNSGNFFTVQYGQIWQNSPLVGGFNPFEKYESNRESSPILGVNLEKNI